MRYIYIIDSTALCDIVTNNIDLSAAAAGSSDPTEVWLDFAAPLSAYEKANLDIQMTDRGYTFLRDEDSGEPATDHPENINVAVSPIGSLATGIGFTIPYLSYNYQISDIIASVGAVGTGEVGVDILVNSVSIFSTTITIDIGEVSNVTAATPYVIGAGKKYIDKGDRVDIQVLNKGIDATTLFVAITGLQLV